MTEKENTLNPEDLIKKYIGRMFNSLEGASIKYFLETGHINGSFRVNLLEILNIYGQQQREAGKKEEMMYWLELSNLENELRIKVNEDYYDALSLARVHGYTTPVKLIDECDKIRVEINKLQVKYGLKPSPPNHGKETKE